MSARHASTAALSFSSIQPAASSALSRCFEDFIVSPAIDHLSGGIAWQQASVSVKIEHSVGEGVTPVLAYECPAYCTDQRTPVRRSLVDHDHLMRGCSSTATLSK